MTPTLQFLVLRAALVGQLCALVGFRIARWRMRRAGRAGEIQNVWTSCSKVWYYLAGSSVHSATPLLHPASVAQAAQGSSGACARSPVDGWELEKHWGGPSARS